VLNGLLIPVNDPLSKYFGPLAGVVFGFYALDTLILMVRTSLHRWSTKFQAPKYILTSMCRLGNQEESPMLQKSGLPTERKHCPKATWTSSEKRSTWKSKASAYPGSDRVVSFSRGKTREYWTISRFRVQQVKSLELWVHLVLESLRFSNCSLEELWILALLLTLEVKAPYWSMVDPFRDKIVRWSLTWLRKTIIIFPPSL
jgi:hypothetical protein